MSIIIANGVFYREVVLALEVKMHQYSERRSILYREVVLSLDECTSIIVKGCQSVSFIERFFY